VITLEELSQLFLANRRFSLLDLLANYAGIWLFGELGVMMRKRLQSIQV
jgi:VanZ family protein